MNRIPSAWIKPFAKSFVLLCVLSPTLASAAIKVRVPLQNAVADCQGALPSYEGAFRKRPTGIANEGVETAFLSCSMQGDGLGAGTFQASITFRNAGAAEVAVNCTLVTHTIDSPSYFPKLVMLPAGNVSQTLVWTAKDDNGGALFDRQINFSCAVPPDVEANYTARAFDEDVGL